MKSFLTTLLITFTITCIHAQENIHDILKNIIIKVDTLTYSYSLNTVIYHNKKNIYFEYDQEDEICEVSLYPNTSPDKINMKIIPSGDFDLIDSILNINNEYLRFKVRFTDLNRSDFLKFSFLVTDSINTDKLLEVPLFPFTRTIVTFSPMAEELYIGEEKIFELYTNNIENVKPVLEWQSLGDIDYKITARFGQLRLHIIPKELGTRNFNIQLQTIKPFLDAKGKVNYTLPPIEQVFKVRQSRLRFLNVDKQEITLDEIARTEGVEIEMDNVPGLEVQKTYRVENQEEPGGILIAEIFIKNLLTNNRVLGIIRTYNYHRESQGYLYIKYGDIPRYITNFSITPKTTINKISIMRDGVDWETGLSVRPGEIIDVKIEGEGLHKGKFKFEEAEELSPDTIIRNENMVTFKLKIPLTISKKRIELYNYGRSTGYFLEIREYQDARNLDFIKINYGEGDKIVSDITGLLMSDKVIRDIVIDFDKNIIDSPDKLSGKQYLKADIKITGKNNELIELKTIDNIVIVPGTKSVRSPYYDRKDETSTAVSLNQHLKKKTYDLDDWAKIEITISHLKDKHGGKGYTKDIELYIQKNYRFDIDVSFPSGLLINTFGGDNSQQYQNFSGISMAMIAQFSFYDRERPGKYKPYRVGAGFLAINAFNLSNASDEQAQRDMSLVVLGNVAPTRKDVKLTFPLYLGGGYKLREGKWFILLGPGIRVNL